MTSSEGRDGTTAHRVSGSSGERRTANARGRPRLDRLAELLKRLPNALSSKALRDRVDEPAQHRWEAPAQAERLGFGEHAFVNGDETIERRCAPQIATIAPRRT